MTNGISFAAIEAGKPHVAVCPTCHDWLWKVGPQSGFFGKADLERAKTHIASDGDTVQMDPPAPLTAHTEFDAQLLKGECPHCGADYWFLTIALPECPVSNLASAEIPQFVCDEGYIEIGDQVDGAYRGDPAMIADLWTVMRQRARWQGRYIRLDVHMVGPFGGAESLVGPHGVASCRAARAADGTTNIWLLASEIVAMIAPAAVKLLRS